MIGGINDTDADADALADLLRGDHAHVNLIPMNPVAHTPWTGDADRRHRAVRGAPPRGRHRDDDPAQSRHGDRGGLRPARRRARRASPPPVVVQRRRERLDAESAAALRGERSRRSGAGRGGGG